MDIEFCNCEFAKRLQFSYAINSSYSKWQENGARENVITMSDFTRENKRESDLHFHVWSHRTAIQAYFIADIH